MIWSGSSPSLRPGFTVVELLVSVSILCILGAIFVRVMGRLNASAQPTLSDRLVVNIESTRASNILIDHIRESLEVVRPAVGETTPFLVLKNAVNEMNLLYLRPDETHAKAARKDLFQLVSFVRNGTPKGETKVLFDSIKRLTFCCTSPNLVQVNLILGNQKGEFGLVTQVGMMSYGDEE